VSPSEGPAREGLSKPPSRRGQLTLGEYLVAVRSRHAHTLLLDARAASRLAKVSHRGSRLLYQRKVRALSRAIELCPQAFVVDSALPAPSSALIGITSDVGIRLHVPVRELSAAARALLALQTMSDDTAA
jgi:hypothetical protein